jgi:uncharacterized phage protein gp47/JayE
VSLQTPTIKEISDNIVAQISASLNQTIPLLPKSFIRVSAKVLAGVFILLYKYGGFMFLQVFVSTASAKATEINGKTIIPLVEWGRLIGIGDPAAATQAELTVEITVETLTGSLPSGTQLTSSTNGVTYITIGAVLLNAATVHVTVRAVSDQAGGGGAGAIGNLDVGSILSFANPLSNVARDTTVIAQTVTGSDAESTGAYRQRIVDRFQKRPQGGAYADYEQWGEEPAGIVNVYPYTSDCPGQVDVYVEATVASSGDPDGIPTTAQLQEVLDSIERDTSGLATRRPANALVNVYPISRQAIDVQILGLFVSDLATVRDSLETALTEYFLAREPYIVGLTVPPRKDRISRSAVGGVVEDIVSANNGLFSDISIKVDVVDVDFYSLGIGEKAKLGSLTYV